MNPLDVQTYRAVWGEWLKAHPQKPRPEPQRIATRLAGEDWVFICGVFDKEK